jgi:hypothetical protein
MLQLFGSQTKGAEQLKGKPPARDRNGLHHRKDVWHGDWRRDRSALP